jgi:hypothetical protein
MIRQIFCGSLALAGALLIGLYAKDMTDILVGICYIMVGLGYMFPCPWEN